MAEKGGIKFLKYYLQKLKSFFFLKDILSFLLFFALSASFWYINALGKERETVITIPIEFVGVPKNISLDFNAPKSLAVTIKDQGLKLFSYSENDNNPIKIDLSRKFYKNGEILITHEQLKSSISRRLLSTSSFIEVKPDSILIKYERLSSKVLPIELVSSIEMAPQYMYSDKIQVMPNRIEVFGPTSILNKLHSIKTSLVRQTELNDTTILTCKLSPIQHVRFSSNEVKVSLFVEQFTEKKMLIPITVKNCPKQLLIRTFPAFANSILTVGLSSFDALTTDDVTVYLDYNDLKVGKSTKQKLKMSINNRHISTMRIEPQEVEFIFEKK